VTIPPEQRTSFEHMGVEVVRQWLARAFFSDINREVLGWSLEWLTEQDAEAIRRMRRFNRLTLGLACVGTIAAIIAAAPVVVDSLR